MAKKKTKMTTGEAVKVIATEMKQMKMAIGRLDMIVQDYIALFERYIEHTSDGDEFVEKMKALIEEKVNEQQENEQADGRDTDGDSKEYAHSKDNVFANFERIGDALNISREKVLMIYLLKHVDGIKAYVNGYKSQREDVRGRITDIIVYLMLLWGMVEDS